MTVTRFDDLTLDGDLIVTGTTTHTGNVGIGRTPTALIDCYTTGGANNAVFERFGATAGTRGKTVIIHSNFGYSGGTGADSIFQSDWGWGVQVNGQSAPVTGLLVSNGQDVVCGGAAIATNATHGFLYVPSCAGTPSGTPTTFSGRCALVYDSSNNKLAVYNGAWKQSGALT